MIFILKNTLILEDLHPETTRTFIKRLTIVNPDYSDALKRGRSTQGIKQYLCFYESIDNQLICPRGFAHQAYRICQHHGEDIQIIDNRRSLDPVDFSFAGNLRPLQQQAVNDVLSRESGLLEAGTGAGKTVMALYIIYQRGQPALIIVHTKELLNQWLDRIENFLGIPRDEIGIIGGGKFSIGERITVATVQSLYKRVDELVPHIGDLIVDECHRAPSRTFIEAVSAFDARYRFGPNRHPMAAGWIVESHFLAYRRCHRQN